MHIVYSLGSYRQWKVIDGSLHLKNDLVKSIVYTLYVDKQIVRYYE